MAELDGKTNAQDKATEAMIESMKPVPWWSDQDWRGLSGACAFQIIGRHASDWDDIGNAMNAWAEANYGPKK